MAVVVPDISSDKNKKTQVGEMFDDISPKYDFLNRVLSLGIDRGWRKKLVSILKVEKPEQLLDVATGTADLAIACAAALPKKITGTDISEGMLQVGRKKVASRNLSQKIELLYGDAEHLPFENNTFDAVTVAFGVRNFENLSAGLEEMQRVLKPGGLLLILEFSQPSNFLFKQLYFFYFSFVLPFIGRMVSKNINAYSYLPRSVKAFPYGDDFVNILAQLKYKNTTCKPLTFGICSLYSARKQ